jgi:predicted  nucleic acid-binding Zn-ribbon protein
MRVQTYAQLQAIDQHLQQLARERDDVLMGFAARNDLRDLRDHRRTLASTLKQERARNSDLQWELEEVEVRLRALHDADRDGPTDPLVARELALLRERRTQLEEHVLQQLERVAELERNLVDADAQVEQAAAAWAEREPQLQADLDRLGHALEAEQVRRQQLVAQLPPAAIDLYDDLQRRHRGTALAPIRNRQCSACRARLPAAVFDLLTAPDPLVRCPRCGRVLYTQPPDSE